MKDFFIFSQIDSEAPGKIQIAKIGIWEGHKSGRIELDEQALNQIVRNYEKIDKKNKLLVDYDHDSYNTPGAPASGWIVDLIAEDGAIFANVEWTPKAQAMIQNKEIRYISPVLDPNSVDPETGEYSGWRLDSAAVTNRPFFRELNPIKNTQNQTHKKMDMDQKETELQKEIEDLKKQNEKLLKASQENVQVDEIEKLKKQLAEQKVEAAVAEGKILASQKDAAGKLFLANASEFEAFLKEQKAPKTQTPPASNLFAGSSENKDTVTDDDLINLATS